MFGAEGNRGRRSRIFDMRCGATMTRLAPVFLSQRGSAVGLDGVLRRQDGEHRVLRILTVACQADVRADIRVRLRHRREHLSVVSFVGTGLSREGEDQGQSDSHGQKRAAKTLV
jgi:hypothetical protein